MNVGYPKEKEVGIGVLERGKNYSFPF